MNLTRSDWQNMLSIFSTRTGLSKALQVFHHKGSKSYLRSVNYHWTPAETKSSLSRQFKYFSKHYTVLNADGLSKFFNGELLLNKPALVISFDDGYRNQFDVAATVLDEFELSGWFFVIALACDEEPRLLEYAGKKMATQYCMNWEHIDALSERGHEIGSHTLTHANVGKLAGKVLHEEIVVSRSYLRSNTKAGICGFCFPYGTSDCYSAQAVELVTNNYEYGFHSFPTSIKNTDSPYNIGRMPCDPAWDVSVIEFRLSGVLDYRYRNDLMKYSAVLAEINRKSMLR